MSNSQNNEKNGNACSWLFLAVIFTAGVFTAFAVLSLLEQLHIIKITVIGSSSSSSSNNQAVYVPSTSENVIVNETMNCSIEKLACSPRDGSYHCNITINCGWRRISFPITVHTLEQLNNLTCKLVNSYIRCIANKTVILIKTQ